MRKGRRFIWTAMGIACSLLLGTAGIAAGGTEAPTATAGPGDIHLGPVETGAGQRVVLWVSNRTQATGRPTLTIFGQAGEILRQRRPVVEPGKSAVIGFSIGPDVTDRIRGRVSVLGGDPDPWPAALHLHESDPDQPIIVGTQPTPVGSGMVSSPIVRAAVGDAVDVDVANLGTAAASYDVFVYDPAGKLLDTGTIQDVAPGGIGSLSVPVGAGNDTSAVVVGPSGEELFTSSYNLTGGSEHDWFFLK